MKSVPVRKFLPGCLMAIVLSQTPAWTESAFMHIPSIPGESTDNGHAEWIDVLSFSSSVSNESAGYRRLPALHGDLTVTKYLDKSSPKLGGALTTGSVLEELALEVFSPAVGELASFECRLREPLVTKHRIESTKGDQTPIESFSFNYSHVDWIYRLFDREGSVKEEISAWWDVFENTGNSSTSTDGNQPPVIDPIGNQVSNPAATMLVDLVLDDEESGSDNLIVKLSTTRPDLIGDLQVLGSGGERKISYTTSALRSGVGVVSAEISDGTDTRSISFPVLIDVEMTPFEGFLASYFDEEEIFDPALVSPILDPDFDGIVTLMEFLLGTNPREFNLPSEAISVIHAGGEHGKTIQLNFRRRLDDANIRGSFWGSENLKDWVELKSSNPLYEENGSQGANPLFEDVSATVTPPAGNTPYFIRFRVLDVF